MNKLLLVCLLVFAPVSLATADLKVAVVDLGKAFDAYYVTKEAQDKLKQKQDTYQKEIDGLKADYQRMGEEAQALDKAANDPTLSEAARQDKATALNAKKQDLQTMQGRLEETITERKGELQDELLRRHKEILQTIAKVVSDYSGPQGYDLVIDKSSISAASGFPIFLYASSKMTDITPDIITLLNKTAPAGGTATPSATTTTPATPAGQ
ncbi:MAG: OmpH family outer membrane protein [Methylacidiphilales bacterium]|nr:OmpH family outer membrane protein [Candidatus Methylacidiphilales bacterium]